MQTSRAVRARCRHLLLQYPRSFFWKFFEFFEIFWSFFDLYSVDMIGKVVLGHQKCMQREINFGNSFHGLRTLLVEDPRQLWFLSMTFLCYETDLRSDFRGWKRTLFPRGFLPDESWLGSFVRTWELYMGVNSMEENVSLDNSWLPWPPQELADIDTHSGLNNRKSKC